MSDNDRSETAWIILLAVLCCLCFVLSLTMGCCHCDPCPTVKPPDVVTMPVPVPCNPIPTPSPPRLLVPALGSDASTQEQLEALAHDYIELWRAWLDASGLIDAYNGGGNE